MNNNKMPEMQLMRAIDLTKCIIRTVCKEHDKDFETFREPISIDLLGEEESNG